MVRQPKNLTKVFKMKKFVLLLMVLALSAGILYSCANGEESTYGGTVSNEVSGSELAETDSCNPIMVIESVEAESGRVTVRGYASDPD